MRIQNSISLLASNQLSKTSGAITRSLHRLSTGKRVNSAGDDSAAYSLGVRLDNQIRGLTQGTQSINQASGILNTASSAISTQLETLQRMREISVQAGNGTLSTSDRDSLNTELQSLFSEFQRITSTTEFNGMKLLDGTFDTKTIQIGSDDTDSLDFELPSMATSAVIQKTIGTATFKTATGYTIATGTNETSSASADFNNDGIQDLVVTDATASLSVYLGRSNGTFHSRLSSPLTGAATRVIAGDFNGDNIQDLASTESAGLAVMLGNGDGTFKARVTQTVGSAPQGLATADINKDGELDIITADNSGNTVSVLLGNGNGTFQSRTTLDGGTSISDVYFGDVNSDGNIDFVSTSTIGTNSVFLGNGNGTFRTKTDYGSMGTGNTVKLNDMNNDGKLDMISSDSSSGSGNMFISLGNGDGTFGSRITATSGAGPTGFAIADVNGDKLMDLVTADYTASSGTTASILLGNGNGTFQTRTTVAIAGATNIIMADQNKDGVQDILFSAAATNNVGVYLGNSKNVTAASDIKVSSVTEAASLTTILDASIEKLTTAQSEIAAIHSRLDSIVASNLLQSESLAEAKSQVIDADIAMETAELVRNQILQQSQIAALSQGNVNAQTVTQLLRNL